MLENIKIILQDYPTTVETYRNPNKELPVCVRINDLKTEVEESISSLGLNSMIVRSSWGKGAWSPTPWVAILDADKEGYLKYIDTKKLDLTLIQV